MTFALYALVVAVCFYGLSQSNHIFVGIADTECSILRFVDEVIDGESKELPPKWAGFNGIKGTLEELISKINSLGPTTANNLSDEIKKIDNDSIDPEQKGKKQIFLEKLKSYGDNFANTYRNEYTKEYDEKTYVLDIVKKFGTYDPEQEVGNPEQSLINGWVTEYKTVAQTADEQMTTAYNGFNDVLKDKTTEITDALQQGVDKLNEVDSSIGDIKGSVTDVIADNAGTIDEYGKLGVKAVFGVLALIDIAIAAFMLLLCFCSGKCCTKCCCCRCICKLFTHLLWNVLAILMIIVFLIGSLFSLIGKIGEDAMSVISFLISDDNLGENKETILLSSVKDYLGVCINGDGEISDKLGIDKSYTKSFDDIKYAQGNITKAKNEFEDKLQMYTYSYIIKELQERREFKSESFSLINAVDDEDLHNIKVLLQSINAYGTQNYKEKWTLECNSDETCVNGGNDNVQSHSNEICLQPYSCLPSYRDWIQSPQQMHDNYANIKKDADIIADMKELIEKAFIKSSGTNIHYFNESIGDLGKSYYDYLNQYIEALTEFNKTIDDITLTIKKYTGDDAGMFALINCKFIGKNLKVMLKYLKEALGGDVYTIGVCLILVGCSLALSISFTILLIVVINIDIDNNKKKNNVPEYALNSGGRVIAYK